MVATSGGVGTEDTGGWAMAGPLFTCWTQSPESSARGGHGALFVNTVLNICHLLLGNSAIGSLSFLLFSFILFPNFFIPAISQSKAVLSTVKLIYMYL